MTGIVTGLYRIRGIGDAPSDVYVTDGTMALDMPQARYHEKGYEPAFGLLPWQDEYEAAQDGNHEVDRT